MKKETLKKFLRGEIEINTDRECIWLEREYLQEALELEIVTMDEKNNNQHDDVVKTVEEIINFIVRLKKSSSFPRLVDITARTVINNLKD